MIENGKITRAVKNMRWNDSPITALNGIEAMTPAERVMSGEGDRRSWVIARLPRCAHPVVHVFECLGRHLMHDASQTVPPSCALATVPTSSAHANRSLGYGVDPTIWTRRDAMSMANTLSYVTHPRHVHTSVVKKSAPAIAPQCARRNVCHDVGRSGTGGSPFGLSIRAIVERPTR